MSEHAVGAVLGDKFVIEGVLGRGGMGVVYAARHRELDQRVAIKCLLAEAARDPEIVERFSREARAAAKIQGEHVARVLDVGRSAEGEPYIVMERLDGHDLAHELASRGPLPVADAVRHVLETCEALAQAHVARIVHRDLKPSNLFLARTPGRRPVVKVLDFGISKVVDGEAGLTKSASLVGTPFYMSPEQLLASKTVDARADIWALGVILHELLVGGPPFPGETSPEVIAKILQNAPAPPRSSRADLPEALEAIIARCLRSNPAERYSNVAQLALALLPHADPADRESAAAIARVLGIPDSVLQADVDPNAPTQSGHPATSATRPVERSTTDVPSRAMPAQARTLTAAVAPERIHPSSTAPGVASASSTRDRRARPSWFLAAGAALVLGAGVATAALVRRPSPPAQTLEPAQAPATPMASPAASPEVLPPLAQGAPSVDPASPASPGSTPAHPQVAPPPQATGAARTAPSASSSAPQAPHNPLDLNIK